MISRRPSPGRRKAEAEAHRLREIRRCAEQLSEAWTPEELSEAIVGFDALCVSEAIWQIVKEDTVTIARLHESAADHSHRITLLLRLRAEGVAADVIDAAIPGDLEGASS